MADCCACGSIATMITLSNLPTSGTLSWVSVGGALSGSMPFTGQVVTATVDGPGATPYTTATVTFSGGGATTAATGIVNLVAGFPDTITITNGGAGYTSAPTVTIAGDGTGAVASATVSSTPTFNITRSGLYLLTVTGVTGAFSPQRKSFNSTCSANTNTFALVHS